MRSQNLYSLAVVIFARASTSFNHLRLEPQFVAMRYDLMPLPILSITERPPVQTRTHRFDIEVEKDVFGAAPID